ncbi:hypothetical protein ABZV31_32280 [Streptomyces sp. NPDC005202]|uniref:hypothetical protein n=1 Tax=Streptomyces sp. NPDC005202 TaxID=3157021 RepID=UPI0033A9091B
MGRRQELSRLRTLMRTARLLTVTGAGGVGKTRRALELAGRLRGGTGDVGLVELDALHDGSLLAQLAAALAVGERAGRTGAGVLVHAIGDAPRLTAVSTWPSRAPGSSQPC